MTIAGEPVFVDTSLLVAATISQHPGYLAARRHLSLLSSQQASTCISPQVCREFLVVLTRQPVAGRTFTIEEALEALEYWLTRSKLLHEDERSESELHRLAMQYRVRGKSLHDCNVVAVMLANRITRLATRNAPDFLRYAGEIAVEPVSP